MRRTISTAATLGGERRELQDLVCSIYERTGFDARQYAAAPLARWIRDVLAGEEVRTVKELHARVRDDTTSLERCMRVLTSPATSMFRQPRFFRALRSLVVPILRTYPSINIWHVGCSDGVYGLAIALREEGVLDRTRIYATDANADVVDGARDATYSTARIAAEAEGHRKAGGHASLTEHFWVEGDLAAPMPALHSRIVFAQHSWVSDGPFKEVQLVVCRDVMIYFDQGLQKRVFTLMDESLCPFGMLAVGAGESLRLHPRRTAYHELDTGAHIYRRVG